MGCETCYASDNHATMVLTCLACKHARPSGFVRCELNGLPLVSNKGKGDGPLHSLAGLGQPCANNPGCPINAKPDEKGRTRWAGMLWRGVAWPLRVVMADDVLAGWLLSLPRPAAINDFPGCGCIDRLKGWIERMGDSWHGSAIMRTALLAVAVLATLALLTLTDRARGQAIEPNWHERTMRTLVNACRMAPTEYRDVYMPGAGNILEQYPPVAPLRSADGLNAAARFHCLDMALNGCFQHNDCPPSTRTWAARVDAFWPGWALLGENVAGGYVGPVQAVGGLIADPVNGAPAPDAPAGNGFDGHRWNIMFGGYTHLGCGFVSSPVSAYRRYYTQDFGRPLETAAPDDPVSPIVDGSHVFMAGQVWLLCNVFDPDDQAPQSVFAVIDGIAEPMALHTGEPFAGTYRAVIGDRTTGCHVYHFRAVDAWGTSWRYPESGELAYGCADDEYSAGDFNLDGTIAMQDIFDFLDAWMGAHPRADFDEDGILSEQDIFDFISAWMG